MGYPTDWKSHIMQADSSKPTAKRKYKLELIEFLFSDESAPILLLSPGYFQNAYIFDLLPEEGISLARYIANKYRFHIFCLHPNGIGNSEYVRKSDIDDIAVNDMSNAIEMLKLSFDKPIYVMGHSTGAICFQTYLAGLTRSDRGNFFDQATALQRQERIKGAALLAGNVSMTDGDEDSELKKVSRWGPRITFLLKSLGWINARILTKVISPVGLFGKLSLAFSKLWSFLYNFDNVSDAARKAVYSKTLHGASAATLIQFSNGVLEGCIKATSGQKYNDGLINIHIPAVQMTFGLDPLAVPANTKTDSFDRIGSQHKKFIEIPGEGHEDFMMNNNLHKHIDAVIDFLLQPDH